MDEKYDKENVDEEDIDEIDESDLDDLEDIDEDELSELDEDELEEIDESEDIEEDELDDIDEEDTGEIEKAAESSTDIESSESEEEGIEEISEDDEAAEVDLESEGLSDDDVEEISDDEEGLSDEDVAEIDEDGASGETRSVTIKELTEKAQLMNRIEAAMFIAGRPVSIEELGIKLELKKKETEELIRELAFAYMDRNTSIEIVQIADKYSMQIKAEFTEHVKKFATGGLIPEAVMRTLTIIALKQPISKALIVKMRGSGAYQHVKFLTDRGFCETYKKGRSSVLSTTDMFSDTFGLSRDTKQLKKQLIEQLGIKTEVKSGDEEAAEQKARKKKLDESATPPPEE